jgi:hypothetical protein
MYAGKQYGDFHSASETRGIFCPHRSGCADQSLRAGRVRAERAIISSF